MNYQELITQRYSVRKFKDVDVPQTAIDAITKYHDESCMRLFPDIETALYITNENAGTALETAAGYNQFLIGAPRYLVLLSEKKDGMYLNAGYIVEDLSLKLLELGLGSCWITFADSDKIKNALGFISNKEVTALLGFGYGKRVTKEMRLNIISMSNVKIKERSEYYNTKKTLHDLIHWKEYGNHDEVEAELLDEHGSYIKEALIASANAPSYLNLQPYEFLLRKNKIHLLAVKDEFTGAIDTDLNLGIVMQHFAAVAKTQIPDFKWTMEDSIDLPLPDGVRPIAFCNV
jgi:hypothetical protein